MVLSYNAYATLMSERWGKTVTASDYARYVEETLLDRAYNARCLRFDLTHDA